MSAKRARESKNLFDKDNLRNGYLDDNGIFHANPTYRTQNEDAMIPVVGGITYTLSINSGYKSPRYIGFFWYDSAKNFIDKKYIAPVTQIGEQVVVTDIAPAQAAYAANDIVV